MEAKGNPRVPHSFLYAEATRPVFVFVDPREATKFSHELKAGHFHSAEITNDPLHVFLPKYTPGTPKDKNQIADLSFYRPHGLESIRTSSIGVIGYVFHTHENAKHWLDAINGTSIGKIGWLAEEGTPAHDRTVFVGISDKSNDLVHPPAEHGSQ